MAEGYRDTAKVVTFVNNTDLAVTFIALSQHDSTARKRFTLQPRGGSHVENVPGKDALTYEDLLMVEGEDENGIIEQNISVTTDELRLLGGYKLIVRKAGEKYRLDKEEMR